MPCTNARKKSIGNRILKHISNYFNKKLCSGINSQGEYVLSPVDHCDDYARIFYNSPNIMTILADYKNSFDRFQHDMSLSNNWLLDKKDNCINRIKKEILYDETVKDIVDKIKNYEQADLIKIEKLNFSTFDVSYIQKGNNEKDRRTLSLNRFIMRAFQKDIKKLYDMKIVKVDKLVSDAVENAMGKFINEVETSLSEIKIERFSGEALVSFYEKCGKEKSSLNSCMTGAAANIYLDLYKINPDKVEVLFINDKFRALLWTCDDGTKVFDRLYPSGHNMKKCVIAWAKQQGYVTRTKHIDSVCGQDRYELPVVKLSTENQLFVTMKANENCKYPYLDTFVYGKFSDGNIVLSNKRKGMEFFLEDSNGSYYSISTFC